MPIGLFQFLHTTQHVLCAPIGLAQWFCQLAFVRNPNWPSATCFIWPYGHLCHCISMAIGHMPFHAIACSVPNGSALICNNCSWPSASFFNCILRAICHSCNCMSFNKRSFGHLPFMQPHVMRAICLFMRLHFSAPIGSALFPMLFWNALPSFV